DGTNWVEIQQIDAGPVNEVDARLTSQLNEKASSQYDSLTIKVPSDLSSVSEAITKMSEYQTKRNVVINILVESGHKPSSSIQLYGGDYSRFEISSEDDIVELSESFPENLPFILGQNCHMPTINTVFDGKARCSYGIAVHHAAKITIKPQCGFINAKRDNLIARYGGIAVANLGIFTGGSQENADSSVVDTY